MYGDVGEDRDKGPWRALLETLHDVLREVSVFVAWHQRVHVASVSGRVVGVVASTDYEAAHGHRGEGLDELGDRGIDDCAWVFEVGV